MFFLFVFLMVFGQHDILEYKLHSNQTHQDYIIEVKKPNHFNEGSRYKLIFIADGSYGVGHFLLDTVNQIHLPNNCIIISIHHTGNIKEGRNRDLIPSDISRNGKENYGQAHAFYLFIKDELVPFVHHLFPGSTEKSFIGHSLSGLFCLYLTFQDDPVFDHFYAISPSIWANHFELLKIERAYSRQHQDLFAHISVYCGSLELFNLIRISTQKYLSAIRKRNYQHLQLEYSLIRNKRHFTIRKPALELIMNSLKS
jgi:hypothetical protein